MAKKYNLVNHLLNFIAVILGVYLAFYLNEKAASNKTIQESQLLMNSLSMDLTDDIKTYEEYQIPENRQQVQHIEKLINLLMENNLENNLENIGDQLTLVFHVENYNPTISTYNSMKSSGKLKIIDNLNLQKELSDYYEGVVPESMKKSEFQVDYFTNELLDWITRNVDLMEMKLVKKDDLILLRNKLIVYQSLIEQKLNSYQMVLEDSKKLQQKIAAEIKSN